MGQVWVITIAMVVTMLILCVNIKTPIEFVDVSHIIPSHEWTYAENSDFIVLFGADGTAFITCGQDTHTLVSGYSFLLLPGLAYSGYRMPKQDVSFYRLQFRCKDDQQRLISIDPKSDYEVPHSTALADWVFIPEMFRLTSVDRIFVLVHQLLHIANADYYTAQSANYLITSLLIEMSDQTLMSTLQEKQGKYSGQINRIASWIKANIDKPLTLDGIAKQFGYNKNYLTRKFREELGVTTQKYINLCKIGKAKELLCRSNMNNKEIAYQLGFNDEKYFMRIFKQYEGLTMQEFRNAYNLMRYTDK
jgi:AraC-like DNA-binding protein